MKILKGICRNSDGSAVVGRILPCEEAERPTRDEAVIAVAEGDRPLSGREGAVGVIRLSCDGTAVSDSCAQIILSHLPRGCVGKIALLDTAAEKLFVSPDLTTVTRYSKSIEGEHTGAKGSYRLYSPEYGRIGLFPYYKKDAAIPGASDCIWDPSPESFAEEYLLESYRDAAEVAPCRALTILSRSEEYRAEEIRAAMLSGVYGNVSLLFGNIVSECRLTEALDALCHAFCELELDGREFNGYLPRGLLIDTPYLLWISKEMRGLDFLVYDLPTLARRAIAKDGALTSESLSRLCRIVGEGARTSKDRTHKAITDSTVFDADCHKILLSCGITELFTAPDKLQMLYADMEKLIK